jgi:fluoroacetyl-CoA thioesterase
MSKLIPGCAAEKAFLVTHELTAAALMARDMPEAAPLPAVWSTPDMIAKMEVVCAALVAPLLEDGQMTVGARNEISHLAPTPEGDTVRVQARLEAIDGRKLTFAVEAFDSQAKVGVGIHVRFIVSRASFDKRLSERS